MPVDEPPDQRVRGRWISATSAERDLGLLESNELARLRRLGTVHHADAGTVVAASGSRVTHVQIVSDGELELHARLDEGRATMAVVRAGGVIGDIPLLLGAPMPFDAIASRDTECIALSRQRWTELPTSSPDLALRWMTSIARRLDEDRRRHGCSPDSRCLRRRVRTACRTAPAPIATATASSTPAQVLPGKAARPTNASVTPYAVHSTAPRPASTTNRPSGKASRPAETPTAVVPPGRNRLSTIRLGPQERS
jgi:CRP-like cAMP-binding protein